MTFRELFIQLADQVGRQHLPVVDDAKEVADFMGQDAIHHELVKRITKTLYKANRCGYLDAPVEAQRTLDALGEIQGDVLRDATSDLDRVRLLDQLGRSVASLLPMSGHESAPASASVSALAGMPRARVRPLRIKHWQDQ